MKELSIEEKAKAYDEAKLRMSAAYNSNRCTIGFMDEIFPELKKSKDERIRNTIYGWICTQPSHFFDNGFSKEEMLAWLEKQCKQETDEWKEGNIIRHGGILALVIKGRRALKSNGELFTVQYPNEWVKAVPNEIKRFLNELEKQGEQNHAWSEEDEAHINSIINYLLNYKLLVYEEDMNVANGAQEELDWLKSLKERIKGE